jgi:hypothetical protein
MDWTSVASQLAQLGLPILGRVLGGSIPVIGPLLGAGGGEAVGRLVAGAISKALGVPPTPEAISNAIESGDTTEVVAKLKAIEAEAVVRWPALAQIEQSQNTAEVEVAKINAESSARVATEIATNGFWLSLYRSILLYAATFGLIFFGVLFFWALTVSDEMWTKLVSGIDMVKWWVGGMVTLLGFHFYTRGKEREAAITMAPPSSPVANVARTLTGRS